MSEETKNPLIESFLKLHERALPNQTEDEAIEAKLNKKVNQSFPYSSSASISSPLAAKSPSATNVVLSRPAMDKAPQPQPGSDFLAKQQNITKELPKLTPGKLASGGVLKMGSSGKEVTDLQNKLRAAGYDIGATGADGKFGPKTAAALKAFQQKQGIQADSVYGRQTERAFAQSEALSKLRADSPTMSRPQDVMRPSVSKGLASPGSNMPITSTSGMADATKNLATLLNRGVPNPARERNKTYFSSLNNSYEPGDEMPNKLIEAFLKLQATKSSNLFVEAKKIKKLDPVGKEDEDIDNDGDKDKTDSYLHNRRKKIAAAMKEEIDPKERPRKDPYAEKDSGEDVVTPVIPSQKGMKPSVVKQTGKNSSTAEKQLPEEVAFSEAELEHIASILEAKPVATSPKKYVPNGSDTSNATGSKSGTLSDEYEHIEEGLGKGSGRGRPKGSKSGARTKEGGEGQTSGGPANPHPFHQIRTSRADSQGNYNLTHELPNGKVLNAKVSSRDAAEFSKKYLNAEKPREKEAHTDAFISKHFGVTPPKPKAGISLPSMPKPKS